MIREDLANFNTTNIKIKLGARLYSFWKSANIHIGMGEICREASFEVSDDGTGDAANILMDSPVVVLCDDLPVLTGYIDDVAVSYDKTSHSITIKARSKTCDLVDCSYVGDTQFNSESARKIIERICAPFGIKVIWKTTDWKIGELNTNVGDTCASIITEICKRGGTLCTLHRPPRRRRAGGLYSWRMGILRSAPVCGAGRPDSPARNRTAGGRGPGRPGRCGKTRPPG